MNFTAPITHLPPEATDERKTATRPEDRSPSHRPSRRTEGIEGLAPLVFAPAFYGPAAIFVMGPWLLLVLLLIGPAALLITLVLVVLVAAALVAAAVALLASPYLLVRHLRARHPAWRPRVAFVHGQHISLVSHEPA